MVQVKKMNWKIRVLLNIFIFITTMGLIVIGSYLYNQSAEVIVSNAVMGGIGVMILLFVMEQQRIGGELLFDNKEHFFRFVLMYECSLGLAILFPLLPQNGWPFIVIGVSLCLFSNAMIGIVSSSVLIFISVMLSTAPYEIFFLYFISCIVAILLFHTIDDTYKIGIPFMLSLMVLAIATMAENVIFYQGNFTYELFIIPIVNICVTAILLLIFLKGYSSSVIYKYTNCYMEITDQEFSLLAELKVKSKDAYYNAIHTAYFADKIAIALGCNRVLAKAGAYYHRIGVLLGENTKENIEKIALEHKFPPELCVLLDEYTNKKTQMKMEETAIVYFSDAVISAIMYLVQKDDKITIDYDQVINAIFNKKIESDVLKNNQISMEQLHQMKQIFMEEKLYYDFLR